MAGTSSPASVEVISPQFCHPHPIELTVVRNLWTMSSRNLEILDSDGNILFKKKQKLFSIHNQQTLVDAAGNTLVTFQQQMFSVPLKWKAFKGDSKEHIDLLFTVKRESSFLGKSKLYVFMAGNTTEQFCDFRIEGSWSKKSCSIYIGNDSDHIVSQMHKSHAAKSDLLLTDTFGVTVYPNVDYAFIVALVLLIEDFNSSSVSGADHGGGGGGGSHFSSGTDM